MESVAVHTAVPLRSGGEGHVSFWSFGDTSAEIVFAANSRVVVFDLTAQAVDDLLVVLGQARAEQNRAPFYRYLREELAEKRAHSSIPTPAREYDLDDDTDAVE